MPSALSHVFLAMEYRKSVKFIKIFIASRQLTKCCFLRIMHADVNKLYVYAKVKKCLKRKNTWLCFEALWNKSFFS